MVKYFFSADDGKLIKSDTFLDNCWVDMVDPTDNECEDVAKETGVPEDMIKAALDEEERARSEFDEGCSMFVVDCPIMEEGANGDSYTTLPLSIIYNSRCIVTVSLKGNTVLKEFITGKERVFCNKPVHFALTFMLNNAKRFLYCLKQIDRKNRRIHSEATETMKNAELIQLLDLQNSLVYFSTSLTANERVHLKLSKVEAVKNNEDYEDLYDDVSIENKQAIETCNIYKNILSVTMDAYGSVISNNSNDSMRKLTIVTVLLAVPTMIAGFWGMNMPVPFQDGYTFLQTGWFWLVVLGTVILTAAIAVIIIKGNPFGRLKKRGNKQKKKRKKNKKDDNSNL